MVKLLASGSSQVAVSGAGPRSRRCPQAYGFRHHTISHPRRADLDPDLVPSGRERRAPGEDPDMDLDLDLDLMPSDRGRIAPGADP